jgi:hypothetical protein
MLNRHLTATEAQGYVDTAKGDELEAALILAYDRAAEARDESPTGVEIHHALYMLLFALRPTELAPSWEDTRIELRRRKWTSGQ